MIKLAALITSAIVGFSAAAQAQNVCPNDAPTPYVPIKGWGAQSRPWGPTNTIAPDANGNIWVIDRCGSDSRCTGDHAGINPIWELAPDGHVLKNFGAGLFVMPHSLTFDKNGDMWITDAEVMDGKGGQVIKMNTDGKVLMRLGKPGYLGAAPDEFNSPNDVAIAPNGDLFIAEGHSNSANQRIDVYSPDGKFKRGFGKIGAGPENFMVVHALRFDKEGRLYVADRNNKRVDVYKQDGTLIEALYQFGAPSGLWMDGNDNLYVTGVKPEDGPGKIIPVGGVFFAGDGPRAGGGQGGGGQRGGRPPAPCGDAGPGIRMANVKNGVGDVQLLVKLPQQQEGVAVDGKGDIYGAQPDLPGAVFKYTRKDAR
jgi:hypothetical protein